jgi:trans-aconitate 2-methyltransferase
VHVESYYDEYVPRQTATGVNARHKSIARLLISFGLQPDHRVLEIGCGIGTVTGLVAEKLSAGGSLLATDLSPKSIEAAKRRLAGFGNVRLLAGDILSLDLNDIFDVVVLPDVIEHIPIESHPALFGRVAGWLKPEGFAFLHYPNPFYLEWLHEHRPELLQIVDQPIHADILLANASPQGLYLEHYETYSIWIREGDYAFAVLRPSAGVGGFTDLPKPRPSLPRRCARRAKRWLREISHGSPISWASRFGSRSSRRS